MTDPHVSFALLNGAGETCGAYDERREYYAASTIKLAVAAALLFAVESGELSLAQTVASTRRFPSRIFGAADIDLALEPEELDPGMPADGTPLSLGWCLERMITVSSNETTNLIILALDGPSGDGVRGLARVQDACERLGVPGIRVTRLICDGAAKEAGFTHSASALELAHLMRAITCGTVLSRSSRNRLIDLLRAQRVPIIGEAVASGVPWGSKSGWDDGIRHDVAFIGEPGADDCLVLAICTRGFAARGAQAVIRCVTSAVLGEVAPRSVSAAVDAAPPPHGRR